MLGLLRGLLCTCERRPSRNAGRTTPAYENRSGAVCSPVNCWNVPVDEYVRHREMMAEYRPEVEFDRQIDVSVTHETPSDSDLVERFDWDGPVYDTRSMR